MLIQLSICLNFKSYNSKNKSWNLEHLKFGIFKKMDSDAHLLVYVVNIIFPNGMQRPTD